MSCPAWCESDHGRILACLADVGRVQVGPNPDDVVIVRLAADSVLPASVVILPVRGRFVSTGTLMLQPADALALAEVFDAIGELDLGGLVREGADILADRPKETA
jgi:hypothetical protein